MSLLGYDDLTIGIIKTVPYLSDLQTRKFFQRSLRRKTTYGWDRFTRLIRMPFPLPPFLTPIRRKGWALWDRLCLVLVFAEIDRDLPLKGLLKGNDRLRPRQAQRLQLFVDNAQQMAVILRVNLDKEIVLPCRIMALHDFRNLHQRLGHGRELARRFQE